MAKAFTVTRKKGVYVVSFPYNAEAVAALKTRIPHTYRRWNRKKKWEVDPKYKSTIVDIAREFFGTDVMMPEITKKAFSDTDTFEVRYIGKVKPRGTGGESCYGWTLGGWNIVFPGKAIRTHFGIKANKSGAAHTYYSALGVSESSSKKEINKGYSRASMQWHPDYCLEPNAKKKFDFIQMAYETLSDPELRSKYDKRLAEKTTKNTIESGWSPPMRCGNITVEYTVSMGIPVVDKILSWKDIVDGNRVLVSSWPPGSSTFVEKWIRKY